MHWVRCPEYRGTLVLQQVTKLFLDDRRESVGRLDYLDDVLVCLMRPATSNDLANVSNALVRSGLGLPKAIQVLARHRAPPVAVPVLRHSSLVSEDDLVEVAQTRELEQLLAIGSRTDLSEFLTTTLIMRGYSAIHTLIARNSSARLSEAGFSALLKIAERDAKLAESLGARSDIPHGPLRKFLAMVAEKPRAAFLRAAPASVKALAQTGGSNLPIRAKDYSNAEKQIGKLRRTGKLNDSAINRFAIMQETDMLTVALALTAETSVNSIERLLFNSTQVDLGFVMFLKEVYGDPLVG
jgi:hypothetical protein